LFDLDLADFSSLAALIPHVARTTEGERRLKFEAAFLRLKITKGHTVTRTTQNEALLWKIAVLGMQKAPP
jgi:hypothetical protein